MVYLPWRYPPGFSEGGTRIIRVLCEADPFAERDRNGSRLLHQGRVIRSQRHGICSCFQVDLLPPEERLLIVKR